MCICALLVKLFYKNNDCTSSSAEIPDIVQGYEKGIALMDVHGLLKMIPKFERTVSFDVQSGTGRKRIDSTIAEELATVVQVELSGDVKPCSAREICPNIGQTCEHGV